VHREIKKITYNEKNRIIEIYLNRTSNQQYFKAYL